MSTRLQPAAAATLDATPNMNHGGDGGADGEYTVCPAPPSIVTLPRVNLTPPQPAETDQASLGIEPNAAYARPAATATPEPEEDTPLQAPDDHGFTGAAIDG